jgi:hypothetical protein
MRGPNPALQPFDIRRDSQHHLPTWIFNAAQQAARLVAKPPCRAHHAKVTAQPGFHPTGMRFFYHNDERWFHVK